MSGNDLLLKHSALQNITPIRPTSTSGGPAPPINPFPLNPAVTPAGPGQYHHHHHSSNNPNNTSNPNSHQNRKRQQAERAAIRQKIRNDLHKQETANRIQKENNEKIKVWKEQILPRWNELQHSNKLKELCAKGIPSNIRGKVWPLLIENQLNIDEQLFDALLKEVHNLFHDKMTAKRHANTKQSHNRSSYEMNNPLNSYTDSEKYYTESIGDQVSSVATSPNTPGIAIAGERTHSTNNPDHTAAIPIPRRSHAIDVTEELENNVADVTEETWFENERQGSLDQEDFDTIQRQLFGKQNTYLYDRMMNSPKRKSKSEERAAASSIRHHPTAPSSSVSSSNPSNKIKPSSSLRRGEVVIGDDHTSRIVQETPIKKIDLSNSFGENSNPPSSQNFKALKRGFSLDMPFELEMDEDGVMTPVKRNNDDRQSLEQDKQKDERSKFDPKHPVGERQRSAENLLSSSAKPFVMVTKGGDDSRIEGLTDSNQLSDKIPLTDDQSLNEDDQEVENELRSTESKQERAARTLLNVEDGLVENDEKVADGEDLDEDDDDEDDFTLRLRGAIPIPEPSKPIVKKTAAEAAELLLLQSPSLVQTPPRREKHSADYLIQAGLLLEGTGTTPIKPISILQSSSPPHSVPPPPTTTPVLTSSSHIANASDVLANNIHITSTTDSHRTMSKSESESTFTSSARDRIPSSAHNFSSDLTFQLAELHLLQAEIEKDQPENQEECKEEIIDPRLEKAYTAVSLIEWDLPRTFPTLAFFHDGGAMHTGLERVLLCFALYRPDIGYVQGMSFLVATLLLYMDEYEAFKCLANLMSRRLFCHFYGLKKKAIDAYVKCFDHYFKKFLPLLYKHLRTEDVTSEMFLMDWYLSVFTKALPLEVAAQVWDMYLCEGEVYMLCVALGILKMYAPTLSLYGVEKISPFLLHLPEGIKVEELFTYISQIHIPVKQYEKVRKKMMEECEVDPEDDVIHFDSTFYQHYRQVSNSTVGSTATITTTSTLTTNTNNRTRLASDDHSTISSGSRSSAGGSGSSMWSKMRRSLGGTKNKISGAKIPAPITAQHSITSPDASTFSAGHITPTLTSSMIRKNRSSNNISDLVAIAEEGEEEATKRKQSRESGGGSPAMTRQRGVSVSSKQEASLLLSLQNSPSQRQKQERQHAAKEQQSNSHQQRSTSQAGSNGKQKQQQRSEAENPPSSTSHHHQRRKSKQATEGCLPS